MMLVDFAISGAGDESRTFDFNERTKAPVGLGSQAKSTGARRSASNDDASGATRRNPQLHRTGRAAMSKREFRSLPDYDIGYGRPPKKSQFRPGQSGNPTGRRKASPTIGVRLQELMNSKITVTERGRSRRISRLDVMLHQLTNDAMRGDQRALKLLMGFLHRYGAEVEGTVRSEEMAPEDLEILSDYLRTTGGSNSDDSPNDRGDDDGESL
jgi:Family of unknown function (DUF5681)